MGQGQEVSHHRLGHQPPLTEMPRRRESEKSLENETLIKKEEDYNSPTAKPLKSDGPLKVTPTPPPKENA